MKYGGIACDRRRLLLSEPNPFLLSNESLKKIEELLLGTNERSPFSQLKSNLKERNYILLHGTIGVFLSCA